MCGIAGIVRTDGAPVPVNWIERMVGRLRHRGPDGTGTHLAGPVALGHARLAIIDPTTGQQPMSNEDGQVWITFNGELYNFRELRAELEPAGHQFRTHSDTETIIHAYEQWGDACVERFRGMFAFAILDTRQRRLFLARDHLGIKPLFYLQDRDCFAFASELQALRALPGQQFDVDLQAIDQYLWRQYIPAPRSVFRQVRKLPPAHLLSVAWEGRVSEPECFWRPQFRPIHGRREADWLVALEEVLRDSVRAHLVADVPFGAFLSGGVDSSAVVAYMSQLLREPVRTFSIGFEEKEFDELPYAQQVAERWQTDHHVAVVRPDALAILPQLVRHYGEPFGDSSALPTYYVSQLARRSVPMVLSGDGGDESFAGYPSYQAWVTWLRRDGTPWWKRTLRPLVSALWPRRYRPRVASLHNWLHLSHLLALDTRRRLWRPDHRAVCTDSVATFEQEFEQTQGYDPCSRAQYLDLRTYLPYSILTKVDVASMIHSLEVRTPLVDCRVVEFAATIPPHLLLGKDETGRWQGKLLLKHLLRRYYPREFLQRPKMGFSVPISRWFGPAGSLQQGVQERLLAPDSMLAAYFEPGTIRELLMGNVSGPLWLLLFLDEWLRQNRTGPNGGAG